MASESRRGAELVSAERTRFPGGPARGEGQRRSLRSFRRPPGSQAALPLRERPLPTTSSLAGSSPLSPQSPRRPS
jgi:hypothetical protein